MKGPRASAPAEKRASDDGSLPECPVCYEPLREDENARTLSCGHVFCQGCLARTLAIGGGARGAIACPVCRHLTFVTPAPGRLPDERHILEVPSLEAHAALRAEPLQPALFRFASSCTYLSGGFGRPPAAHPARATHVFVISSQGRPMAQEEQISVGTSATEVLAARVTPSPCTSALCAALLLVILCVLAGAAGVLG